MLGLVGEHKDEKDIVLSLKKRIQFKKKRKKKKRIQLGELS